MSKPTCAVCGYRDSIDVMEIDGRWFNACEKCIAPSETPIEVTYRDSDTTVSVRSYLRGTPGAKLYEVCSALNLSSDIAMYALRRLVDRGYATYTGTANGGRQYTLASDERCAELDAERQSARVARVKQASRVRFSKRQRAA